MANDQSHYATRTSIVVGPVCVLHMKPFFLSYPKKTQRAPTVRAEYISSIPQTERYEPPTKRYCVW